jgi:hypothetical protein
MRAVFYAVMVFSLAGFIPLKGGYENPFAVLVTQGNLVAKVLLPSENVFIPDNSVCLGNFRFQLFQISELDNKGSFKALPRNASRCVLHLPHFTEAIHDYFCGELRADDNSSTSSYLIGRRLPSVFEGHFDSIVYHGGIYYSDVGSQFSLGGILHRFDHCLSGVGGFLRDFQRPFSSRGGSFRDCQRSPSVVPLLLGGVPQFICGIVQIVSEDRYDNRGDGTQSPKNNSPPIGRRFFVLGLSVLLCGLGCWVASNKFNDKWGAVRASLVWLSFASLSGALLLFWLTNFRCTWGWWL